MEKIKIYRNIKNDYCYENGQILDQNELEKYGREPTLDECSNLGMDWHWHRELIKLMGSLEVHRMKLLYPNHQIFNCEGVTFPIYEIGDIIEFENEVGVMAKADQNTFMITYDRYDFILRPGLKFVILDRNYSSGTLGSGSMGDQGSPNEWKWQARRITGDSIPENSASNFDLHFYAHTWTDTEYLKMVVAKIIGHFERKITTEWVKSE